MVSYFLFHRPSRFPESSRSLRNRPFTPPISRTRDLYLFQSFLKHCNEPSLTTYVPQNNQLDPSSVRLQDCTHWVPPCCQSLVPLIGSHSPRPVRGIWHSEPPDPPHHSRWTWHYWLLVHILPDESHRTGHMEWPIVLTLHFWHWCLSRLCTEAPSVLPEYRRYIKHHLICHTA